MDEHGNINPYAVFENTIVDVPRTNSVRNILGIASQYFTARESCGQMAFELP